MMLLRHLPNAITCLNLLCGCLALICLMNGDALNAAFLVIAAAGFDFLDGFVARLLKVSSAIGAELDSLADMVTFGVVPGFMLLHYLKASTGTEWSGVEDFLAQPLLLLPLAVPVFSALRLAKFNVDDRQTDSFRGLPTPASALWVISIPLIIEYAPIALRGDLGQIQTVLVDKWYLIGSSIGLSVLMVSDIPLLAMKFKGFAWNGNAVRYVFLITSAILLIILRPLAIPLVLSLYVLISIVQNLANKNK